MTNIFESASMTLKNGMTLLFKDQKARDALEKKYGPDNPPPHDDKNFWYGACSTAAGTTDKVATTTTGDFVLRTGAMVRLLMGETNIQPAATLSVDGTTAKRIKNITSNNDLITNLWRAGEVIDLVYDGTQYVVSRGGLASTAYYGATKLSNSVASSSQVLAATPKAVKTAYDLAAAAFGLPVGTEISASDNLNDYTTPGTYACLTQATAGTLSNCPVSAAFKLVVLATSAGRYMQVVFSNTTVVKIYARTYTLGGWNGWYQIGATEV